MPSLVVDSGRLHWLIGRAGEDSPDAGVPSMQTAYEASVFPQPGDQQAWSERWEANWALFEAYEHTLSIDDTGDEDRSYDGIAVFTASVFDGPDTGHIHDITDRVFAPGSKLRITHIHFVLQEICILYSSGRTTGLVINLGHELTVLGVYEGHMLGETARRAAMTANEDVYLHDDFQWEDSVQLAELVMGAVMSAPIDTRRGLLSNILIGGGRWGGWPQLASHLRSWLEPLVASRLPALAPSHLRVIQSPEAGASAWIGGSVLGSIMRTRVPYLTGGAWRRRQGCMGVLGALFAKTPPLGGDTPPHLLRQDSGPLLLQERWGLWDSTLLPADEGAWKAAAQQRAWALVCAAPSLCAKLPPELCELIAAELLRRAGWLALAAAPACTFLPPLEDTSSAAPSDLREGDVAALDEEEHAALRRAHAPCVELLRLTINEERRKHPSRYP